MSASELCVRGCFETFDTGRPDPAWLPRIPRTATRPEERDAPSPTALSPVSYPAGQLNDNERVVLDLRPHWWFCAGPGSAVAASAGVSAVAALKGAPGSVQQFLGLWLAGTLLWLVCRGARWATTRMVLTTERLIHRSGVLAKHEVILPLDRINTVFTDSSLPERLLGAGDLTVESAGERGQQTFRDIRRPGVVQQEIDRQAEARRTRSADSGPQPVSRHLVLDDLERLGALRDAKVVSQSEFETLKAAILDRQRRSAG